MGFAWLGAHTHTRPTFPFAASYRLDNAPELTPEAARGR